MKYHLLKKIFSSGLQAVAVQVLGMLFFLAISFYLSKDDFGLISWANAVSMMLTTILSFGMEQVVVRRIAASKTSEWAAAAYLFHTLAGSVLTLLVLWGLALLWPGQNVKYSYLPWFFLAQSLIYIGTPLKQFLNAKQRFTPYGVIAVLSNILKLVLAFVFISSKSLSILSVLTILIICSIGEIAALLWYVIRYAGFSFRFRITAYTKLIRESLPQYFAVIFDSSLSRMDWILLGSLSTGAATANYAFANRAFELSRLPIVIIAPIILNSFARNMVGGNKLGEEKKEEIRQLFVLESFVAMMLPLVFNLLWSPVIDYVFKGKYGTTNATEFMLLSLCLPIQFFTNLLWTVSFSSKEYKAISVITISSAVINILLNLVLIKYYNSVGASIAYFVTSFLQMMSYFVLVNRKILSFPLHRFIVLFLLAAGAYYIANTFVMMPVLKVIVAITVYVVAAILLKQVGKVHIQTLKLYFKK